jgi:hypothetical protein
MARSAIMTAPSRYGRALMLFQQGGQDEWFGGQALPQPEPGAGRNIQSPVALHVTKEAADG